MIHYSLVWLDDEALVEALDNETGATSYGVDRRLISS